MKEVIVILDNIRSALNVGAIFRTCDGAGVKKLILAGITPYPPHPKIIKTSLGAEESVNFDYVKNPLELIKEYKKNGFQILSIEETPNATNFFDWKLSNKIVFIFGHEITGVSPEIMRESDTTLILPMKGKKNSLNVATTIGIVLYNTMFAQ